MLNRNAKLCIIALFLPVSLITQAESTTILENKSSQLENATNELVDWKTYQDDNDGYKMQYPQEWKIVEPSETGFDIPNDFEVTPDDIGTSSGLTDPTTSVTVYVENVSRTLDPASLQIQSLPLEHYANELTGGSLQSSGNIIKNEAITFNGQPAWQVNYIYNYEGSQLFYGSHTFVIKDDKLYEITFATPPLKVEQMRPVGEKIIQTFQFFNNTGSVDPLGQPEKIKPLGSKNAQSNSDCEESYPDVCITMGMECSDVSVRNFQVTGSDPNNFDQDGDGIGCEE